MEAKTAGDGESRLRGQGLGETDHDCQLRMRTVVSVKTKREARRGGSVLRVAMQEQQIEIGGWWWEASRHDVGGVQLLPEGT